MQHSRILVPVSFGPQSEAALKQARKIALEVNGMISCLYVIEKPGIITGKLITREMEVKIRRKAELELSASVNRIYAEDPGLSYELIVTSGKVHRKIVEKASELGARMIIMGRSDETDLTKQMLGSNAYQVVARSAVPVLVVRNSRNGSFKHLLLPLDLSNPVALKISKTIELAEIFKAKVTICSILKPGWPRMENACRERLAEIKKLFGQYDISCRSQLVVTQNRISDEILAIAGQSKADQIVLMTQKEPEYTDMFIGSTAREVLRKSNVPVLSLTPRVFTGEYPFKSLFGNINNPISWFELDHPMVPKS